MSYPVGTHVETVTLPESMTAHRSPVVVVFLTPEGEVWPKSFEDYREAQGQIVHYVDSGHRVLVVVEGETDLSYGTSTAWVAR